MIAQDFFRQRVLATESIAALMRPEPAPLLSQGQVLQVVSRGMGAMSTCTLA